MNVSSPPVAFSLFVAIACGQAAFGNQLINGSFETPIIAQDSYLNIGPGGQPFSWQVTTGDIDIVRLPLPSLNMFFNAYDGNQILDLNGLHTGAISQSFPTVAGAHYLLTFAYANNARDVTGVATATVNVSDVGTNTSLLSDSIAHSSSSDSAANYVTFSRAFFAIGSQTRLAFVSTSANDPSGGVFLDAIDVSSIPEPSTLLLLSAGSLAMLGTRRRKSVPHNRV